MRAVVLPEFGSAPELRDVPLPRPGEGEVRVRVHAASVNGFDLAVANSYLQGRMEHRFPVVLGKDFSGVIDAVAAGVAGYAVGDRVFGVVTKPFLGDGSFGEYVTVPAHIGLAKLPDNLTFNEAAALGLAGTAAWDAVQAAALGPDSTVLIAGATGGVGSHAVQLAAAAGARVIATARTDPDQTYVAALGAHEIVGYRDTAAAVLARHPEGIDVVIHLAGDAAALLPALRAGGRLVSTLIGSADQLSHGTALVVPVFASPATKTLERLAANQSAGATAANIQRIYPLEEAPAALADFAAGKRGKLVITL